MSACLTHALRPRRLRRSVLALTTALGSLGAMAAQAQSIRLPQQGDINGIRTSTVGLNPELSTPAAGQLNINLRAENTVITWNGFNIPEGETLSFTNGRILPGGAAVLNRDVSTNVSQLLGKLSSGRDVAVWVHNPNGILVGSKAAFNTGSLVLSTLDISPEDFVAANGRFRLRATATGEQSAITVQDGAKFTINGETRGLVMLAPKIDAHGEFIAQGQDVAFVSAADVTLDYRSGSPLSVTINRGTAVAGTSQYIRGKVEGNNALFALASQSTLTDSLLQVSADVTTASAGSRGIVLSAGRTATPVAGVTVGDDVATTGGLADVLIGGTLRTQGGSPDVAVGASRAITLTGGVETSSDVTMNAGGRLTIAGGIGAGDDISFAGAGITIGSDDGVALRAGDQLLLSSTDGDIVGTGVIALQSGSTANDSLVLETRGDAGGNILLGRQSRLVAGDDRSGTVALRLRAATNAVSIGDVDARSLRSGIETGAPTNGLRLTGTAAIGNVNVREALLIEAAGITGGTIASDRSVDLQSGGAISVEGINARSGSVNAVAIGPVTVSGAVRASGSSSDVRIDTAGAVTLGDIRAARDILIGADAPVSSAVMAGTVTAERNYQIDANSIVLGDGTAKSQAAGSAVRLTAGGGGIVGREGLTLTADSAGGTAGLTLAIDPDRAAGGLGAIDFAPGTTLLGGNDRQSDVRIRSADLSGSVRLGQVRARGLLGAVGTGEFATGIARSGAVQTGDMSLRRDVMLSGATITTGGLTATEGAVLVSGTSGGVQTGAIVAIGNIGLTAAGTITTGALTSNATVSTDAAGALAVGGDVVGAGAVTLRGASVTLGGAAVRSGRSIDILARTGGIAGASAVTIASTSNRATDFIRLQAVGAEGIAFSAGSRITGGSDRQLNVRVLTAADAPLVLGDVTARSLGTLAQLDSDPLAAAGAFRSQGSLAFGRLNLVDGFTAESTGGNLSVEQIAVTGAGQGIDLRAAAGTLSVQADVAASGAVTLASGTALTLGTVTSSGNAVLVSSGGALTATSLTGATGVSANAAALTVVDVNGGAGAIVLSAATGDLSLGGVSGSAVTLRATGGAIGATGPLLATAGSVDAEAAGAITADGSVTAVGGGVRLAALNGALSVTGNVLADNGVSLSGTSMTLGVVESRTTNVAVASPGIVQTGALTAATGVAVNGTAVSVGNVQGGTGAVTLTATAGDLTLGAASGTAVSLRASGGAIGASGILAATNGAVDAEAAGAIAAAGVLTVGGGIRLQATSGALSVTGNMLADDSITLAGTSATLGAVRSRNSAVSISSSGGVQTGALTGATGVTANGAALSVGDVQGGTGAVALTASSGNLALRGATGSAVTLRANRGAISASGPLSTTNGALDAQAATGITAADAISTFGGGVILQSRNGAVSAIGGVLSAADVMLAGSSVTLGGDHRARGAYTATASAGSIGRVGDTVAIRSDSDGLGGEALVLTTIGGAIDLPGVRLAGGDVTLRTDGAGITIGAVEAARLAADGATASSAVIRTGDLTLGTALTLDAAGGVRTGSINIANGAVSIASNAGDVSTGAITASGNVRLSGESVAFGTVGAAALTARARTGPVIGGDITVQNGAVVSAPGGAVTLGRVSATNGDIAITSGGALFATAVDAGGAATITGTGTDADVVIREGVTAEGAATVHSARDIRTPFIRSITSDLTVAAPNGRVAGFAPDSGIDLEAGPGGAFSLTVGTDALLGDVTGGNISITATSITADSIAGGTQAVSLRATAGDLRVNGPVVGGDVTLTSVANTRLGTVDASGAVVIGGDQNLSFDTVSGTSITATGGAIIGAGLQSPGMIDVRAASITIDGIEAGGALTAHATNSLSVNAVNADGAATFTSNGSAALGTISVVGALTIGAAGELTFGTVSGGSVSLAGAGIDGDALSSAGMVNLRGGTVSLDRIDAGAVIADVTDSLDIRALTANRGVDLTSAGSTTLGSVSAGGTLSIATAGPLSFDQLSAGAIQAIGGTISGNLVRSPGNVALGGGSATLNSVNAGGVVSADFSGNIAIETVVADDGATLISDGTGSFGTVTASAALTIDTAGLLSFGELSGGSIAIRGGTIRGAAMRSPGAIDVRGGDVTLATVEGRTLNVAVNDAIGITTLITTGDATLTSGGMGTFGAVATGGALAINTAGLLSFEDLSGGSISIRGGTIQGATLRSPGSIGIRATTATLNRIETGATLTANAIDSIAVATLIGNSAATLTSGGAATLGSADLGGALAITAGGALSLTELSAASVTLGGATITGGAIRSPGTVDLQAGTITLDTIEAGALAALGTDLIAVGTVETGETLAMKTAGLISFEQLSGGSIQMAAGTIDGGAVRSLGAIDVRATGVTLDLIDVGGSLTVNAVDSLAVASSTAGGPASLTSGGVATLGTVSAGGALAIDAGGALSFEQLSGRSITLDAAAVDGVVMRSPGKIDLKAETITLDDVEAGAALSAIAADAIAVNTIAGGEAVALTSGGTGAFGTVTAGGELSIATAGDLSFTQLSGGSVTAGASGGSIRGSDVRSTGAATIRGTAVDLVSAVTGGALRVDAIGTIASVGTITSGGDTIVQAATSAIIAGAVSSGGAYRVTAGAIALGGNGVVQQARGDVRLTTTVGVLRGASGLQLVSGAEAGGAGAPVVLDSAGGIDLAGTAIKAQGSASALSLRAGSGQAIRLGTVEAGAIGGFDGQTAIDRLTHSGDFNAGDITAGSIAITLTGGDLATGRLTSIGAVSLATEAGAIRLGELAAGSFEAKAASTLSLGSATIAGRATLDAGNIVLPSISAQSLAIRTPGALTGAGDGRSTLRTTGGDLDVDARSARLGEVASAGAATLRGGTIDVGGRLAAARQLLAEARDTLTIGDATAGADMTLKSAGALTTNSLDATGALGIDGINGVTIAAARSGGAMRVTSGGPLALGNGTASGGIALDATGLVRIGALSGGPSVTIRAADADLTGTVRATTVRFETRDPATMAMRVGDGTFADGFRLSAAEVGQVAAETLALDAGAGTLEVGTLALMPEIGRSVQMLSTGEIRVTGQLSSSGGAQLIRLGGDSADGHAETIHVVATSDAGGRLLVPNADLELRGNRIAVGLAPGFIDTLLPGDAGRAQAVALIGNANSALYNPQLGGGFYAPDATTTVAAQSLSVRFGDYALFQNTAIPGQASGATIGTIGVGGGAGTGAAPTALSVSSFGPPASASFAFFGSVNGITGASTALLANPVIDIDPELLPNSRINGCLARSGAGCLTTIVIQPTLQVFDWNTQAVFGILQDVALPFTPIIGGNNEELLSGLPALAPEESDTIPSAAELQEPKP